jgi:hypothetical protein
LGVGTLAFALFSPSTAGCSTNVVVLTHSAVTARGCAAFSVVAHIGAGLVVLGAVLLLGSFALVLRSRRPGPADTEMGPAGVVPQTEEPPASAVATGPPVTTPTAPAPAVVEPAPTRAPEVPRPVGPEPAPAATRTRPIAPGEDVFDQVFAAVDDEEGDGTAGLLGSAVHLPPGWYGNPNIPGKPVQWWDGTRLIDRPD